MRSDLFFKVEVEHDEDDDLEKLGNEIVRQIQRVYGVRLVELSSVTTSDH